MNSELGRTFGRTGDLATIRHILSKQRYEIEVPPVEWDLK
jgi:hypothetical protein